jgi:hypothetical protein
MVYNEPPETNPCNDLTYGNDPNGIIAPDADSDWPAPPAYTNSLLRTDSTSVHPQSRTSWSTIPSDDTEHITSDIENLPPTYTDLKLCQAPGTTECSSNHPHSHGAEYFPPPYDEGDDNPIDRGGQSLYILPLPKTLCTRTAIGTATDCTATRSQKDHHQAARMLPHLPWDDDPGPLARTTNHHRDTYHPSARVLSHFPWDDDPGPSESTTKHQRDMYHPAARVLPHFPWDDDPGLSESTPKHQRDMYHPAARMLSYFPSDDDPDLTNICTIQ